MNQIHQPKTVFPNIPMRYSIYPPLIVQLPPDTFASEYVWGWGYLHAQPNYGVIAIICWLSGYS